MMYYCRKIRAVPPWADKAKIKEFYEAAKRKTLETGIIFHVDHVVPLQSDIVCGLHVFENLQLLTADENRRKQNSLKE